MQKRTTPKTRTFTDPHLAALLLYVTGSSQDDHDNRVHDRFARAIASVDALFAAGPPTSTFGLLRDRPEVYELVSDSLGADIAHWTDPDETRRIFDIAEQARKDGDEILGDESLNSQEINTILPGYINAGLLIGACLMHRLLNGGAR